jgi:hypothetical protein
MHKEVPQNLQDTWSIIYSGLGPLIEGARLICRSVLQSFERMLSLPGGNLIRETDGHTTTNEQSLVLFLRDIQTALAQFHSVWIRDAGYITECGRITSSFEGSYEILWKVSYRLLKRGLQDSLIHALSVDPPVVPSHTPKTWIRDLSVRIGHIAVAYNNLQARTEQVKKFNVEMLRTSSKLCRRDADYLGFSLGPHDTGSVVSVFTHHIPGRRRVDLTHTTVEGFRRTITLGTLSAWDPASGIPYSSEAFRQWFQCLAETLKDTGPEAVGNICENHDGLPASESKASTGPNIDQTAARRLLQGPILAFRLDDTGSETQSVFMIHPCSKAHITTQCAYTKGSDRSKDEERKIRHRIAGLRRPSLPEKIQKASDMFAAMSMDFSTAIAPTGRYIHIARSLDKISRQRHVFSDMQQAERRAPSNSISAASSVARAESDGSPTTASLLS